MAGDEGTTGQPGSASRRRPKRASGALGLAARQVVGGLHRLRSGATVTDWSERASAALGARESKGEWKVDLGVYMDPDGDDHLAFARGPMIAARKGESYAAALRGTP